MNWQDLNQQKKIQFIVIAILLFILLFYFAIFKPIQNNNVGLKNKLQDSQEISDYLNQAQQKLFSANYYPTLNNATATRLILSNFSKQKITPNVIKLINAGKNKLVLTIKGQEFYKIISALKILKLKHGIVVNNADIKKTKNGIVNAKLTLVLP